MSERLPIVRLRPEAKIPSYMSAHAAGMDLAAALTEPMTIGSMERVAVPTGLAMAVPTGYEGQVRPRSGLARRHGITVANAPGTIDADYRGEVMVLLVNLGQDAFTVQPGERIAQLVIAPVTQVSVDEVSSLDETARGDGGFGSTGL